MKEHRNKYIKVRMTPEEVRAFKEKSAGYKTVSHYVRKALEEYSNVSVRKQLVPYRRKPQPGSKARQRAGGCRVAAPKLYPGSSVAAHPGHTGNRQLDKAAA